MKPFTTRRLTFIGKSLLWSLVLYMAFMVAVNWDDVRNSISDKRNTILIRTAMPDARQPVTVQTPAARTMEEHSGAVNSIMSLVKAIAGFSGRSASH